MNRVLAVALQLVLDVQVGDRVLLDLPDALKTVSLVEGFLCSFAAK